MHANIVEFEVFADYALFSDPLTRVGGEKCSYQIPTYEALKGILHSVYWKPTIIWYIDKVKVINQIQMETKGIRTILFNPEKNKENDISYYTYLKDCRYQVQAHFEFNKNRPELECDRNENKHHNIAKRMIEKGGRRDIFLGSRECQGYVEPCVFGDKEGYYDKIPKMTFGLMYHGITYADEAYSEETKNSMTIRFWQPVIENGVITFIKPQDCTNLKKAREMGCKVFGTEYDNFTPLGEEAEEVL